MEFLLSNMVFTLTANKKIESQIEEHMKIIKETVLKRLDVKSIVLIGTFSRGEGAVFVEGGVAIPANDYDLYLIVGKHSPEKIIFDLQEECVIEIRKYILKKGGKEDLLGEFNVDFKCLTIKDIKNLPPFLRFYEMKNLKSIYGKNYLNLIEDYGSIPLSEGLRWIFNDASHIMDHLFLKSKKISFDDKTNYFLSKLYLCVVTSFLIIKRDIGISIIEKNKKMENYDLPIQDFKTKLKKYTRFRLNPKRVKQKETFFNFFEVQKDFESYFKFYLSKFIKFNEKDSWIKISEKIKEGLYKEYYAPYLEFYFRKFFKIKPPKFLLDVGAYLSQYYFSFKFGLHRSDFGNFKLKYFFQKDPGILIIASLPLLLFSIRKDGSFNNPMLMQLNENLNKIIESEKNLGWDELRKKYTKIYKLYYWQKFI